MLVLARLCAAGEEHHSTGKSMKPRGDVLPPGGAGALSGRAPGGRTLPLGFMGLPVERPPSHVWHALSPGGRTSPLGFMGLPVEQQLKQLRNGFSGRCIFVCGRVVGGF